MAAFQIFLDIVCIDIVCSYMEAPVCMAASFCEAAFLFQFLQADSRGNCVRHVYE